MNVKALAISIGTLTCTIAANGPALASESLFIQTFEIEPEHYAGSWFELARTQTTSSKKPSPVSRESDATRRTVNSQTEERHRHYWLPHKLPVRS